jgi:hypothetical protein
MSGSRAKKIRAQQEPPEAKKKANEPKTPRHQRLRIPDALPKRPDENSFAFARTGELLKFLSLGQIVLLIEEQPEWELVLALVRKTQAVLPLMSQSRMRYTLQEAMRMVLLRVLLGKPKMEEVSDWLAGDRGSGTRRILGFDEPRDHIKNRFRPHQKRRGDDRLRDGVPSEATVRRYVRHLGMKAVTALVERAFEVIVTTNLKEFKEMREAARFQFSDGSGVETCYTAPHYRKQPDGSYLLLNKHRITAPEAGSTGGSKQQGKNGDGWWLHNRHILTGECIAYAITPWHKGENTTALNEVLPMYERIAHPYLDLQPGELIVESADSGYHSHEYRRQLKELRIVDNIHQASHAAGRESTDRDVGKKDDQVIPLEGTNWHVNGHLEPFCDPDCREGVVERHFEEENGKTREWTEGKCDTCGHLNLTPGEWLKAKNPARYVKAQPGDTRIDWELGAPITFHTKLGEYYGGARHSYQEGAHGAITNGPGLLKHKRCFDETVEVRLEAGLIYFIQHVLSRYVRREMAKRAAAPPPAPIPNPTARRRAA